MEVKGSGELAGQPVPWSTRCLRSGGLLVPVFARVTGTGAGMAVLYLLSAMAASVVTLAGFLVPRLRNLEKLLPDHEVEASL